jgi:hypothetical protein
VLALKSKKKMPLGVKIISLLNLIFGFGFLIAGVELLFNENLTTSLFFMVFSIPSLIVGFSFYNGKKWGWIFAIVSYTVGIVVTVISAALGFTNSNGYIGVVVSILIVAYLNMSHVKAYFEKETMTNIRG